MNRPFCLSASQRRTLRALTHVACPPDVATLGCEDRILGDVELALRSFAPMMRWGILATLIFLEWSPVVVPASFARRFSTLPRTAQERHFAACWHSALALIRQAMKGVKGLVAMAYYDLPEVKERLGYRPEPWIAGVKAMRLERFGDAIAQHEHLVTAPDALVPATRLERRQENGNAT